MSGGDLVTWAYNDPDYKPVRLTPEQRKQQAEQHRQNKELTAKDEADKHAAAAKKALFIWNKSTPLSDGQSHAYLVKKGVKGVYPVRVNEYQGNASLVIPVGKDSFFSTLQFINPDGGKTFLTGGKKSGCYSILNKMEHPRYIAIGEGFATVASVIEDKSIEYREGLMGVMALDAGNLEAVAVAMRKKYPTAEILIFGDMGDPDNKGEKSARAAAVACGGSCVLPPMASGDFNDYLTGGAVSVSLDDLITAAVNETRKTDNAEPPQNAAGHSYLNDCPDFPPLDYSTMPYDTDALNYGGDTVTRSQQPEPIPTTPTELPNVVYAKLAAHVELFNKTHAHVLIGGKHRIMRTVPASASNDGRESYEFLSQDSLAGVYQNTKIQTGFTDADKPKPIFKDYVTAWARHSKSRTYTGGVLFKPAGVVPDNYFNTWQGFTVPPKQNNDSWALIRSHIDEVICAGDAELIKYVYDWIAYTFQNPDKPAGAALVLRGEQGTGKGSIAHFLSDIWGNHAAYISSPRELIGNFNGHLADTCFLFADEAFFSGDKSAEGRLKSLITEPNLSIERKGIDSESQPNYLKIIMATNNEWAVPADKDSRRYCVCDVSSAKIGDRDYFNALLSDCKNKDVQAAFLHDMLNRDISDFHTGNIPDTDGLKAQRLHSLNSMGKWIVDSLNAGYFAIDDKAAGEWVALATAKDLFSSYVFWCDNQRTGEHNRFTQTTLGKYLGDIGFETKKSGGWHRQLGSIESAIIKFETFERVKISNTSKK